MSGGLSEAPGLPQLTGRDAELMSSGQTGNISLSSKEFKTGI